MFLGKVLKNSWNQWVSASLKNGKANGQFCTDQMKKRNLRNSSWEIYQDLLFAEQYPNKMKHSIMTWILFEQSVIKSWSLVATLSIVNLLFWQIFPASGGWPVLSPLSSSNPPYPLHPVALLPSFHVFLYQVKRSFHWPASLSPSYFQLQHFLYLHLLISSYNIILLIT